jgi:SM-20-related protein
MPVTSHSTAQSRNPSAAASAEACLFQTPEVPPFAFGEFLVKVLGLGKQILIQEKVVAMTLDLERFEQTPLNKEPFEYLVVPEFVKSQAREGISDDYPKVEKAGSFPLSEVTFGPKFKELTDDLLGSEFRAAVERKFSIDLTSRPTMITVRGRCSEKDGKIHTDSKTKIITVLLYLNSKWESPGGRLRLLRSEASLDDMVVELPPLAGTLLVFKRSDNSWHGHQPFTGERRVIQLNWVTDEDVVRREQSRHRFSATIKKILGPLAARH